jgi:CRP-like cAMP-binding protein
VVLGALGAEPPRIAEDLTTVALVAGWGFLWLRLSGMDPASLFTTSAIVTAVLAFSMQETLGNVLGGVLLQVDRSIQVGDWVRVDDVNGRVVEVRWRHTAIETRNRETVIVPNGWLMKNRFTVIGSRTNPDAPWRRWIYVNVDIAASPGDVLRTLESSVTNAAIKNVATDPSPTAVLLEIGPRHGRYALRYWLTDPGPDDPTDTEVRMHMLAALRRAGMKLGVPYQEQFDIRDDDAHRAADREAEHARRIAALGRVELFASLSDAERETLARHLVFAPFVRGDVMTRQGAVAHWLYLVIEGEAEVYFEGVGGVREFVTNLAAGNVFGEMGMMTGAPRSATVIARTDVVCYRLDKAGFAEILSARPDLAETMSKVLAQRQAELHAHLNADPTVHARAHDDILARIRTFFGLEDAPAKRA